MVLRVVVVAAASVLFASVSVAFADETRGIYGTYSSLKYNEEGGDLLGYEFRFAPSKHGLKAIVQVSEGGVGEIFLVDVRKSGEKIEFDVPIAPDFKASFVGIIQNGRLEGDIIYPTGSIEKISISRGRSYWDR